jgi:cytochrome b561
MKTVSRYHPLLVTLHWILAVLIIAMLGVGIFKLDRTANTDLGKIDLLLAHMSIGMAILLLMLIRFAVRLRTARPQPATTGSPLLDRLAPITHYGFYVLIVLMVASGISTAILAGLNYSVFQHSGEPLPASFRAYPTFIAHATLALLLIILIALHVLAALYHHVVRRDGPFRRMGFGQR